MDKIYFVIYGDKYEKSIQKIKEMRKDQEGQLVEARELGEAVLFFEGEKFFFVKEMPKHSIGQAEVINLQ